MQELILTCPFTGVEFTALKSADGDLLVIHPLTGEQIKIDYYSSANRYAMPAEVFENIPIATPYDLIDMLQVTRQRVTQIVQNEVIPVHYVNNQPVFLLSDVLEYKKNRKVGAPYGNTNASKDR